MCKSSLSILLASLLCAGPGMAAPQESFQNSPRVHELIRAYRTLGHLQAHLDPLSPPPPLNPKLQLLEFALEEADLDTSFDIGTYLRGGQMRLRDIVAALQETYCSHVGVEYAHIQDRDCLHWLQERIESTRLRPRFSNASKVRILRQLHKAELFEKFLHTKYVGQKRFSLEGGETIIAALDSVVDHCPDLDIEEIVMEARMGMPAHARQPRRTSMRPPQAGTPAPAAGSSPGQRPFGRR